MKIYIRENGITFVGKAWQIKHLIKRYMKQFDTIEEWMASHSLCYSKKRSTKTEEIGIVEKTKNRTI